MPTAERGTFCIVIHEQLVVASCPLPHGSCMWKHRVLGTCTYNEEFANSGFNANDYALHVGLPPVDQTVVNIVKRTVVANIRKAIA